LLCSNRTIVGLKQFPLVAPQAVQFGSNRTIVGLKHGSGSSRFGLRQRSNRTIVGLKLGGDGSLSSKVGMQQSHHCGIETRGVSYSSRYVHAAIAPLWD